MPLEAEVKTALDTVETTVKEGIKTAKEANDKVDALQKELQALKDDGLTQKALDAANDALQQVKDFLAKQGRKGRADEVIKTLGGEIFSLIGDAGDQIKKFAGTLGAVKGAQVSESKSIRIPFDSKAVADMTAANNLTGNIRYTYRPGIIDMPYWPVHFRDLVAVTPSETDSYHFYRHTGGEGAIDFQSGEGATKAQVDEDYTEVIVNLNYLAGFLVISRQLLRNLPALQSQLSRWLPEQYYQTEDAKAYAALAGTAGLTVGNTTDAQAINRILKTVGIVEKKGYVVTSIVVNPVTWADLLCTASTDGVYTMPGGVVVSPSGALMIAGIPIVKANWVPDDTAVIGDWRKYEIIQSEALSLRLSEHDNLNFRQNKVTALIEASVGFAVLDPAAFSIITLTTVTP